MFERFTDRARRVVVLAQEEARFLKHDYIGTEHLLLGLVHDGEGIAAQALDGLGVDLQDVREQVTSIVGRRRRSPTGHMAFTPRAKKIMELALRESLQLGHNYIGTEHILLALVREGEGVAAQVLQRLGADLPNVREQVMHVLSGYRGEAVEGHLAHPVGPRCPSCHASLETLHVAEVTASGSEDEDADERPVRVAYCPTCGVFLGVIGE